MKTPIPPPIRYSDSAEKKVYPRDSVRLFKSDLLEIFTHVHPAVPALIWIPIMGLLTYRSFMVQQLSLSSYILFFLVGLVAFTLVEYALHRFIFHFPAKNAITSRLVYIMHGLHHEDPQDPTRLVMPPLPGFIYGFLLYSGFRALFGSILVDAFFAGFLLGYLAYDYIHYYVHHFTPRTAVGKYLKRYHMVHHFSNYESKWGVSNPLWDYVFGTVEPRDPENEASKIKPA